MFVYTPSAETQWKWTLHSSDEYTCLDDASLRTDLEPPSPLFIVTNRCFVQRRRGKVKAVSTDEVTMLFSWDFPNILLTMLDVSKRVVSSKALGNNVLNGEI